MNERIKEVADFVGITENNLSDGDMSYKDLEKFAALIIKDCAENRIAKLEAEVKMLRKDAERYWCLRDNYDFSITQNIGHDWINLIFADEVDAAIDAARESK